MRGRPFGWFRLAWQKLLLAVSTPSAAQSALTTSSFAGSSGTWTYTARDASGNLLSGVPVVFTVDAEALIDAAASIVTATSSSILNDGIEAATMTTEVLDTDGDAVVGVPAASVVEASTGSNNTLTAVDAETSYLGRITTTLKSTSAETKTLSATVMGLAITDTASVVVSGPPSSWTTNLPAGPTLRTDLNFAIAGDLQDAAYGSASNTADATAPSGDGKVVRFVYPAGSVFAPGGGVGQCPGTDPPANTVRAYCSFNWKYSSNFTLHPANHKIIYLFRTTSQTQGSMVLGLSATSGDLTAGGFEWNLQPQTSDATRYLNENSLTMVRDQWYHIEMLAVMNTVAGTPDGIFRVWVDGVRIMNYTNVLFTDVAQAMEWRSFSLNPYYGGNSPGHTIATECYAYCDRYTTYTDTARA